MYLKHASVARNRTVKRHSVQQICHKGVTLRLKSTRVNCARFQTVCLIFNDAQGRVVNVGPRALSELGDTEYVTQYDVFKACILRWLKRPDTALPVHVELAVRALITREDCVAKISDMLKTAHADTQYACEKEMAVSLSPERAMLAFPSINGYYVRLDFRLKRKKYVTYFSITHPDRVMENALGEKRAVIFLEERYGYILGVRGLYSLLFGWLQRSTSPNADMLQATGPQLLEYINGDKRKTIDEFFTIINGQVSTHVSIP